MILFQEYVDELAVFKIEGKIYDTETDQILEFSLGPTHDRSTLRRMKQAVKGGLKDTQELLEIRKDTIVRGTTERTNLDEKIDKKNDE